MRRRKTRTIQVGGVTVGGDAPVSVQSMTNTDTRSAIATSAQIAELAEAGCEIVRIAVPDEQAANAIPEIIEKSPIPVIADIHFDYNLALLAVKNGIHGLRINPGNIGKVENVRKVAECAGEAGIPIRVGVNAGSVRRDVVRKHEVYRASKKDALVAAMVENGLEQCEMLEKFGFNDIKVSLKASDIMVTLDAYRMFARKTDYPLHVGLTEAGTPKRGVIKSAIGIGVLLLEGIGDTIRVSLTADPVEEVFAGIAILESVQIRQAAPEIISCPTCGRTEIDLLALVDQVEAIIAKEKSRGADFSGKKIAVMGCAVNGPGEARDADLGIAGGKNVVVIFKNGNPVGSFSESEGLAVFERELKLL